MSLIRSFVKDCIPPIALRAIQQTRVGKIQFKGDFASWDDAAAQCSGYDANHILYKVLNATLRVKRGEAAFERDSVLFNEPDYAWSVLAGLMWAAARNNGVLNVLDFGGALGSSYFQNRNFLQDLPNVQWNVVEQAHYVDAGEKYIQSEQLRFYATIDDCLVENQPNVVLLSSVLQYLKSPEVLIEQLPSIGANCLIIDRTPLSPAKVNRLAVQHVPASIYLASYPIWIFSDSRLQELLAKNWSLIAKNLSPEGRVCTRDRFEFSFQGMLLNALQ